MASYCQCGHVWGVHEGADEYDIDDDLTLDELDEDVEYPPPAGMCFAEEGCDCDQFENLTPEQYAELDRGYS